MTIQDSPSFAFMREGQATRSSTQRRAWHTRYQLSTIWTTAEPCGTRVYTVMQAKPCSEAMALVQRTLLFHCRQNVRRRVRPSIRSVSSLTQQLKRINLSSPRGDTNLWAPLGGTGRIALFINGYFWRAPHPHGLGGGTRCTLPTAGRPSAQLYRFLQAPGTRGTPI